MMKRIAVIGPESTGKTVLCRALAQHYHTVWVPEYAREYLNEMKSHYTLKDLEKIAHGQLEQEKNAIEKANRMLFADTELIIVKVWMEDVFGSCPEWIKTGITDHRYDLYLLTSNDIPWIADPLRENKHRREYFFNLYRKELDERLFSYSIISGTGTSRLSEAVKAIENKFGIH